MIDCVYLGVEAGLISCDRESVAVCILGLRRPVLTIELQTRV